MNEATREQFTHYVENESGVRLRTIKLKMTVQRRVSWNQMMKWYLRRHDVSIKMCCNPRGLELQAEDYLLNPDELSPTEDNQGFWVNITGFLRSVVEHRFEAEPSKTYPFFIRESRESRTVVSDDLTCYINPVLIVDGTRQAPWFLRWAVGWNPQQHKIQFKHGGI